MRYENLDVGFVGSFYGKSKQIEILCFHSYKEGRGKKDRLYQVKCHECAKDPELYGDAVYITDKSIIVKNIEPCGCSTSPRLSLEQNTVLIKRACEDRKYKLLDIIGEYKGVFSKILLKCDVCDHEWQNNISATLLDSTGCMKCRGIDTGNRFRKSDEYMIKSFFESGKFQEGTNFWRSSRKTLKGHSHWFSTCTVCSNDKYVKAGFCSGIFESPGVSLQRGAKPCRCNFTYKWTKKQREFQINEKIIADNLPYKFIRYVKYKGYNSQIIMHCPEHDNWVARVDSFLYNNSLCPSCAKTGYNRNKQGWFYILKAEGASGEFTGYGISNTPKRRIKKHTSTLAEYGFKIMEYRQFDRDGITIANLEKLVKSTFPRCAQEMEGFKTEATYAYLYQDVIKFVEEQLDKPQPTC